MFQVRCIQNETIRHKAHALLSFDHAMYIFLSQIATSNTSEMEQQKYYENVWCEPYGL